MKNKSAKKRTPLIHRLARERKYSAILVVVFWGLAVFVITVLARSVIIEISKEKEIVNVSNCEEEIISLDRRIKDYLKFSLEDLIEESDERSRTFFSIRQGFKAIKKQCDKDGQKALNRELLGSMKINIDTIGKIDSIARKKLGRNYRKFEKNKSLMKANDATN